ncbi:FISUMP domain-containing protein [Dawidia soli]|uniref:Fibronectin type-III domain-containing protein n=1 Tax=Dawidia soli TaxID=2782352 RepID=A0AAP2DFA4_9BACT|nr:FISUMP domain-containing protein [Dawidia soli]MBT1688302.1 hypothetical protein [Dawidia soli]
MKTRLFYLFLPIVAFNFSCDDEEKPKSVPIVVTSSSTDVTPTTAIVSGSITSTGNSTVIETGFVYSSNVSQPTTADNVLKSMSVSENFSVTLQGLTSATTYHVRAYAINDVGTGYGEVIDIITENAAPMVTELSIEGSLEINSTVTAKYKYTDSENDPEGTSLFQWYAANDANGVGETAIAGATSKTLIIEDEQIGKFLRFSVTPMAATGTTAGNETKSEYSTAVGAENVTFNYNGVSVTYGIIISNTTQRKWLDRNLGATRSAQTLDDYQAYGHYFQWGRLADGHQIVTRTGPADANVTVGSGTTTTKSTDVVPPDSKFIIDSEFGSAGDWLVTQDDNLWQGVEGINNPCPTGWRIPTKDEWDAEAITSLADGFDKLKLTYTGYRSVEDGGIYTSSTQSYYWTSTVSESGGNKYSFQVRFSDAFYNSMTNRANGIACRCIKD